MSIAADHDGDALPASFGWLVFIAVVLGCAVWLARPMAPTGTPPRQDAVLNPLPLQVAAERFEFFDRAGGRDAGTAQPPADPPSASPSPGPGPGASPTDHQRPIGRRPPAWMKLTGEDATLDNEGLSFTICCGQAEASAWLPALARGRYYLEASVEAGIGATGSRPVHGTTAAGLRASGRGTDINQFFAMERYGLRTGDTVMIAIDALRGRIYYGINGRWLNGQPGGQGGEALDTGRFSMAPAFRLGSVRAGETQRWRINPGTRAFLHVPPGDFHAYITADSPAPPIDHSSRFRQPASPYSPYRYR